MLDAVCLSGASRLCRGQGGSLRWLGGCTLGLAPATAWGFAVANGKAWARPHGRIRVSNCLGWCGERYVYLACALTSKAAVAGLM